MARTQEQGPRYAIHRSLREQRATIRQALKVKRATAPLKCNPWRLYQSSVPRSRAHLHIDHRKTKSQRAYGGAPLHAAHECVSKSWENHWAAIACWFAFYNFCRVHKSLRVTPAMAAGISNTIWACGNFRRRAKRATGTC